jgi:hypothetical protein
MPDAAAQDADRLKFEAASTHEYDSQEDTAASNLERWLLDNGASFPLLEMKQYDTEVRGIHARLALEADTVIIEVTSLFARNLH